MGRGVRQDFVPRDLLTRPMDTAATFNLVIYIMESMRSFILEDWTWSRLGPGFTVVTGLGIVMVVLNGRMIRTYD